MSTQDKLSIGIKNIENANYLHDEVLPMLINAKRWELVAYQSHLDTELLLAGIVTLLGREAKAKDGKHNLESLLQKLENCFDEDITKITPYIINVDVSTNFGFIIEYIEDKIVLWKKLNNIYTQLGSALEFGDRSVLLNSKNLELEYEPTKHMVSLMIEGKQVWTKTDPTFPHSLTKTIRRCYDLVSDIDTIRDLKSMSQRLLTHDRFISSRYSLETTTESQAFEVKTLSDKIFALANRIIVFNKT